MNKPIEYILKDIKAADEVSRERERNFKEQCRTKGANKEKPTRPEDICIQVLMSNITNASLVQRALDAERNGERFLYTKIDEIELLDQIKSSGGNSSSELIRIAFDCGEYGQDRVGSDSVTGTPKLRWNWNASTTIEGGKKYFRKGLLNGTLSRINFCTIIKPDDRRIPKFKTYDDGFALRLKPYITLLNTATGKVECKKAIQLAEQLLEENLDRVALSDDEVLETLSYRANVIAYLKAMILYICNGYKWSKDIEDFVRWSEVYDLWCKMQFFGEASRKLMNDAKDSKKPGPRNLLDILPLSFTLEDVAAVRLAQGLKGDARKLVSLWKWRKMIEETPTGFKKR